MAPSGKWIDGIGPETMVEDAARRSLEPRLATVAQSLPLAAHLAEHDIEHVHRLRVATRRATAALKLYRQWLPRKPARWVKKRLRMIRRAASDARDLDVLTERLRREPGAEADRIVRFLAETRAALQPGMIELAENLRREDGFVRKTARLVNEIVPPDAIDGSAPPNCFGDWAPRELAKIASDFVDAWPNDAVDIEALHRFRIRAKALRYAIELLAPAFGPQMREVLYPAVEELQEQLGRITDHVAAMKLLAESRSHAANDALEVGVSAFVEAEKHRQIEDLQDFQQWWTSDRAEWLKRRLAKQSGRAAFNRSSV